MPLRRGSSQRKNPPVWAEPHGREDGGSWANSEIVSWGAEKDGENCTDAEID